MSWLCIHPWSHLNITPSGNIRLCCHHRSSKTTNDSDSESYFGNLKDNSIEEIFNGPDMKRVRQQMLKGEAPPECIKCDRIERMPAQSPRQRELERSYSKDVLDNYVTSTQADGTANYSLKYWDLRFSNVCNMSCVMCSSNWSSQWITNSKQYTKKFTDIKIKNDFNLRSFVAENIVGRDTKITELNDFHWVDDNIDQVENIYFAGGEPLIMPSHWYILDKLHKEKRFDVKIKYNTNMSKLTYAGKNAIDYWKDWPKSKLRVEASIDETEHRAEWIRYGTNWDTIKNNILAVQRADIMMRPIVSVGAYNILRLPELVRELSDLFKVEVFLNLVTTMCWQIENINYQDRIQLIPKIKEVEHLLHTGGLKVLYYKLQQPQIPSRKKNGISLMMARCALLDINRKQNSMDTILGFREVNQRSGYVYDQKVKEYSE